MSASKSPERLDGTAVLCKNVRKEFYLYQHRTTSMREFFIRTIKKKPIHERKAAFMLKDLSLRMAHGEAVGLIGRNGSGKSTALRLIAGVYKPTSGVVETRGRVSAVLELGAGFSQDLTGSENISLKGVIMGLSPDEIEASREAILDFAELGNFIDTPMKFYSSGMKARLAFAIAFCIKPDILLLDEVFAVGDEAFRKKCTQHLQDFCAGGRTIILASHSVPLVRQLCTRAIWLDKGVMQRDGPVDQVLDAYHASPKPTTANPMAPAKEPDLSKEFSRRRTP
ncbi:MAG: ABC transporter ATP-binding protein [Gammaproteobacteria bacterium]|nr:ABC transporter ATP-binding protein [Gammaproteobacteria bacterium]NNL50921.1 ABC transporter ATP-binding protein [Woeseiaceae bacterium]